MKYALTIHQKPTYLHAIVNGCNSKENVMRYLDEVLRECIARNYVMVLIEERLEGPRLRAFDVFDIAAQGSGKARDTFKAVAYIDVNAESDLMKFAETVAVNRSLPVAVFSNLADAEQWLLSKDRVSAEAPTAGTDTARR
jgi:hypothetical protein